MSTLEKAIAIASEVHEGQFEKAGAPYIMHPLRLMMRMNTEAEMMAAVLHDVPEDSDPNDKWTIQRLRDKGFSEEVLEAVDSVTERNGESYEDFVERAGRNRIGRKVKMADIEDNMNLQRIRELRPKDLERLAKYHKSRQRLIEMNNNDGKQNGE
ncbi:MAG: HD domain-containing protein [Pyrinomonadaceae bacterium]